MNKERKGKVPASRDIYDVASQRSKEFLDALAYTGTFQAIDTFVSHNQWASTLFTLTLGIRAVDIAGYHLVTNLTRKTPDRFYTRDVAAEQVIYRGKEVEWPDGHIKPGDKVLYIRTPDFTKESSPKGDYPEHAFLREGLDEVRERMEELPYTTVAIQLPNPHTPFSIDPTIRDMLEGQPLLTRKQLLGNKDFVPKDDERQTIVVSRERFEEMTMSPKDQCIKLAAFLDTTVKSKNETTYGQLWNFAQESADPTVRTQFLKDLKKKCRTKILTELSDKFDLLSRNSAFENKRHRSTHTITVTSDSHVRIQRRTEDGNFSEMGVERLLGDIPDGVNTLLHSPDSLKIAQIAYRLHTIISSLEHPEDNHQEEEDIKKKLKDANIKRIPPEHPLGMTNVPKTFLKQVGRRASPFVAAAAIAAIGPIAENIVQFSNHQLGRVEEYLTVPRKDYRDEPEHRVSFEGPDSQNVEWHVRGVKMDEAGYYTTATSSDYHDGNWHTVREREGEFTAIEQVAEDAPHIKERKNIPNQRHVEIKVPIKNDTRLAHFEVRGPKDKTVTLYQLKDGTIEAVIDVHGDILSDSDTMTLEATLVPSDTPTIRTLPPTYTILYERLNDKAQKIYNHALKDDESLDPTIVSRDILESHTYSINPSLNQERAIRRVNSPEDVINTVMDYEMCNCDACNSAAGLLARAGVGMGFLLNIDNPAARKVDRTNKDSFVNLRTDFAHLYEMNADGTIDDATPYTESGDLVTQQHLHELNKPNENEETPDPSFVIERVFPSQPNQPSEEAISVPQATQAVQPVTPKPAAQATEIVIPIPLATPTPTPTPSPSPTPTIPPSVTPKPLIEGVDKQTPTGPPNNEQDTTEQVGFALIAGLASLLALRQIRTANKAIEDRYINSFTPEELHYAQGLFTAISWGNLEQLSLPQEDVLDTNKKTFIQKMRSRVRSTRVTSFVKDPTQFDLTGISPELSDKLRILGKRILH